MPIIYLNIWDDYPAPMYNRPYYESCDALLAISKQTKNINELVLGDKAKGKIIEYVPHGLNENIFKPLDQNDEQLVDLKKNYLKVKILILLYSLIQETFAVNKFLIQCLLIKSLLIH
jgi:hypothetical protein